MVQNTYPGEHNISTQKEFYPTIYRQNEMLESKMNVVPLLPGL